MAAMLAVVKVGIDREVQGVQGEEVVAAAGVADKAEEKVTVVEAAADGMGIENEM
jgi:hypothetical protein